MAGGSQSPDLLWRSGRPIPAHHLRLPDSRQGWPVGYVAVCSFLWGGEHVHMDDVYPSSSLVFAASNLSISAAALSAICWICGNTAQV